MIIVICTVLVLAGILLSVLLAKMQPQNSKRNILSLIIKFVLDIFIASLGVFIALYFSNRLQNNLEINQAISICKSAAIETNSVKQDVSSDVNLASSDDDINISSEDSITVYSVEMLMQNQLAMSEFSPDTYASIYHFQKYMTFIVPTIVNYNKQKNGLSKIEYLKEYEVQLQTMEDKLNYQILLLQKKKSTFNIS